MSAPSDEEAKSQGDASESTISRLAEEAKAMLNFNSKQKEDTQRKTQNITSTFREATSQLLPGQLVKDEFFTLFESVGALEIMDPKMDSGFVPDGDTFDADFDPAAPLQADQIIWIIDQLLCLEITWLDGYPLSQTLFTSLHVDRLIAPDNKFFTFTGQAHQSGLDAMDVGYILVHKVLRAYCIALVKCAEAVSHTIQGQTFYEEEDFVTHLFGRELLPQIGDEQAVEMVMDAKNWLEDQDVLPVELRDALEARLLFREQYLGALHGGDLDWEDTFEGLADMDYGHPLGAPMPDAFSSKVQRQLATSTPPRPMLEITWKEAMTRWQNLIETVRDIYNLTVAEIIQDPQCLQRAVWTFVYKTPPPGTYARALLQEQLFSPDGDVSNKVSHIELLLADLRNVVLAGDSLLDPASFQVELTSDPRHIRSRLLEQFVQAAIDEYMNLYRMVCQNRCRVRRTFTQAIPLLDSMVSEAARTDQMILDTASGGKGAALQHDLRPLSTWARHHKLQVVMWTVQLGFETEIYMDDELGGMYWFLDHLAGQHQNLLDHSQRHLEERIKRNPPDILDCFASRTYLRSARLLADANQGLASALSTLHFHLTKVGIVASPTRDFAKQQLFYEARMKPYLTVENDRIPSAADFTDAKQVASSLSTVEACEIVESSIKTARGAIAELKKIGPEEGKYKGTDEQYKKEMKQLETTCVAIVVNVSQLRRMVEKFGEDGMKGKVACTMEKRWHAWWVVPVLKVKN